MAQDIFISYSADDKTVADNMCAILESNGMSCWIAPRDILPGMDWGSSIIDAIGACKVMVLVLSSHSNASIQVKREVERAVNKGLTVIPFRIENITLSKSLEYQLSLTHWMDALTPPMEKHLQRLAKNIQQLMAAGSNPDGRQTVSAVQATAPLPKRATAMKAVGLVTVLMIAALLVWWFVREDRKPRTGQASQKIDSSLAIPDSLPKTQPQSSNTPTPINKKEEIVNDNRLRISGIIDSTYDVARELLMKEGWQPNERHWSYGNEPQVQGGNGPIFWKKGYWELESSSGSGAAECRFQFIDPGKRVLLVVTQGEEAENGEYHARVTQAFYDKP